MTLDLKDLLLEKPLTAVYWELEEDFTKIIPFFQEETEVRKLENFEEFWEWIKYVEVRNLVLGYKDQSVFENIKKDLDRIDIEKRRKIFILLISPQLKTLDRKQAFLLGVNLVVHPENLGELDKILNKAKLYWEILYKPYFTTLEKILEVKNA